MSNTKDKSAKRESFSPPPVHDGAVAKRNKVAQQQHRKKLSATAAASIQQQDTVAHQKRRTILPTATAASIQQQNTVAHQKRRKSLSAEATAVIQQNNKVTQQLRRKNLSPTTAAAIQQTNTVAHQKHHVITRVHPNVFVLKRRKTPCKWCGKFTFVSDTSTFCCNSGTHMLPKLQTNRQFKELFKIRNISTLSSHVNDNLAFSSLGAYPQHGIQQNMGPLSSIRLHGRTYSRILPSNSPTSPLYYYIIDKTPVLYLSTKDKELLHTDLDKLSPKEKQRITTQIKRVTAKREELTEITGKVRALLIDINPYAKQLQSVRDTQQQSICIDVELNRRDGRQQTVDLRDKEPCIAFRYGANTEEQPPLNTVVFPLSELYPDQLAKFVPANNPLYNALQYPLLFPFGELGSGKLFYDPQANGSNDHSSNNNHVDAGINTINNNNNKSNTLDHIMETEDLQSIGDEETEGQGESLSDTEQADKLDLEHDDNDDDDSDCSIITHKDDDHYFDLNQAMNINTKDDQFAHYFGEGLGKDMQRESKLTLIN